MAIARRSDGSDLHATSTASLAVTLGVVPVNGDQLVAIVSSLTTAAPTAPAGWTLLGTQAGGANSASWVYYRTAAAETGSYTWTGVGSVKAAAWVGCYSGVDTSSAPAFLSSNPASSASIAAPLVTVPNQGWAIAAACCRHTAAGAGASAWTDNDPSDSARVSFGSNAGAGADIAFGLFDTGRALTYGLLSRTLTSTNTEGQIAAWGIALAATGAPAPTIVPGGWGVRL